MLARIFLVLFLILPKSYASEGLGIVAIVGDEVITNYDLEQRIRIISLTSGRIFSKEHMGVLARQIREVLITEKIQQIEAKKANLKPSESKVFQSYKDLVNENNMSIAKFDEVLKKAQVDKVSFKEQISSTLTWQNLLIYKIRPTVNISDFEINDYIQEISNVKNEDEYLVQIIEFPISTDSNIYEVESLIEKIYSKVIDNNLPFSQVVKDFSATNSNNSEAVWKSKDEIREDIQESVILLKKGELSKAIKTERAYYLVYLKDKRVRKKIKDEEKLRAQLYKKLFLQKLEAKADSYIKNLKRATYIERKSL